MKYIVLLFLFIAFDSSAQNLLTISGTVNDENGAAIEFATVVLKSKVNEKLSGRTSDQKGKFKFEVKEKGTYLLQVSFIGYEEWKQEISFTESMNVGVITMKTSLSTLEEVVVTGQRVIIEKHDDKLVFNVDQSPVKEGFDGMEVLERAPSILIDSNEGILMRNQAARILINGKQLYLTGEELAVYIKSIRSENIKSIEIQTNQSSSTDAESTGGVINIILKKRPIGFDGTVRSEIGTQGNGTHKSVSGINLNYGAQKWNLYSSFNNTYHIDQGLETVGIEYFGNDEKYKNESVWDYVRRRYTYRAGMVFDLAPRHIIGLEYSGSSYENQIDYKGILELRNTDSLLVKGKNNIDDDIVGNDLQNIAFNYSWTIDSTGGFIKVFSDYLSQKYFLKNQVSSTYEIGNNADNTERNFSKAGTIIYTAQADLEKKLGKDIGLQTGLKYSQIERDNTLDAATLTDGEWINNINRTTAFSFVEKISAGFLTLSKKIKEKNFVKIGFRVEHTDLYRLDKIDLSEVRQNYIGFFPSLFASRDLKNGNIISFNFIKSLRRPGFRWLNNNVIKLNDFRYQLGNPDLRPEYKHNLELGIKQEKQTFSLYGQLITESLNGNNFLDENNISYFQVTNSGKELEAGLEYNRFGNIKSWWFLKVASSLYYRQFTEASGDLNFQQIGGNLSISSNFKMGKTASFDISSNFVSRSEGLYYAQLPFSRVHLTFQKNFFDKKLNVRLYFDDIFDKLIYREEQLTDTFASNFTYKAQKRAVRLFVSYNFSNKNEVNKRKNDSKNDAKNRL